jgi:hypothetical protein
MPRFYFHLRTDQGVSRDTDGIDFESINEAYLDAFRAATDLWRELLHARKDPRLHAFEITDASGEVLVVLPFTEVLDTASAPRKARHSTSRAFASAQETFRRNSALTDAIVSEIRAARNHLDQARVLLSSFEANGSKVPKAFGSTFSSR